MAGSETEDETDVLEEENKKKKPDKFYSEKRFNQILKDLKSDNLMMKQYARLLIVDYLPLTTSLAKTNFFRVRALQMMNLLAELTKLEASIKQATEKKQEKKNPSTKVKKTGKRETKTQKAINKLKMAMSSSNRFLRAQKDFPKFLKKLKRYDIEDDEDILEQVDVKMATRIEMNEFAQWRAEENKKWPEPVFSGMAEYYKFSKVEKLEESVSSKSVTSEDNADSAPHLDLSMEDDDSNQPSSSSSSDSNISNCSI